MHDRNAGSIYLLAIALLGGAYTAPGYGEMWLQKRVRSFIFHGGNPKASVHHPGAGPLGIGEAARALAQHAEVPVCIEWLPTSSIGNAGLVVPIEINSGDSTVKDLLDEMVAQDPRYIYRARLGVVELLPKDAESDPQDCLNLVIPSFTERNVWNGLIADLRTKVAQVAQSARDGVVRDGSGLAHPPPGLIEANFRNQSLRNILTLLCASAGNMAWTADYEGPRPACGWISFHTYQPRAWYPSDTVPLTYSQIRPKACIRCHYHKPGPTR